MSDLRPFAFSIASQPGAGWTWRALQSDGHIAQGEAPTRAAAAAFVIRVLARNHMQASEASDPGSRSV